MGNIQNQVALVFISIFMNIVATAEGTSSRPVYVCDHPVNLDISSNDVTTRMCDFICRTITGETYMVSVPRNGRVINILEELETLVELKPADFNAELQLINGAQVLNPFHLINRIFNLQGIQDLTLVYTQRDQASYVAAAFSHVVSLISEHARNSDLINHFICRTITGETYMVSVPRNGRVINILEELEKIVELKPTCPNQGMELVCGAQILEEFYFISETLDIQELGIRKVDLIAGLDQKISTILEEVTQFCEMTSPSMDPAITTPQNLVRLVRFLSELQELQKEKLQEVYITGDDDSGILFQRGQDLYRIATYQVSKLRRFGRFIYSTLICTKLDHDLLRIDFIQVPYSHEVLGFISYRANTDSEQIKLNLFDTTREQLIPNAGTSFSLELARCISTYKRNNLTGSFRLL